MNYRVVKDLPKGQRPGDIVDLNEDEARVLLLVEAVEPIPEEKPERPRRRYSRRDLEAED